MFYIRRTPSLTIKLRHDLFFTQDEYIGVNLPSKNKLDESEGNIITLCHVLLITSASADSEIPFIIILSFLPLGIVSYNCSYRWDYGSWNHSQFLCGNSH